MDRDVLNEMTLQFAHLFYESEQTVSYSNTFFIILFNYTYALSPSERKCDARVRAVIQPHEVIIITSSGTYLPL